MSRVIAPFAQFFNGDGTPLENGWLKFLNSNSNNSLKNTYADADQSIANANPLQLDAEGRCPNVFGEGVYRVELYTNNPVTHLPGALIQQFDPVYAEYLIEGAGGNFAEWDTDESYQVGSIVIYNGKYYRSYTSNNQGNMPDTATDEWEQIAFLRYWNADVTYLTDDIVISGSQLYFSLADANTGNVPLTSPAWWDPVGSGTILLNWSESSTTFQPNATGYDLGSATNIVGDAWINFLGQFTSTPSSLPTLDYHIANKIYVDTGVAGRMNWTGEYVEGAAYSTNDVVFDEGWRMIAITETTDRPSPQATGDSVWVYDTFSPAGFSETSVSQNALFVGQRYEYTTSFFTQKLRVFIPTTAIGDELEIWMVYAADTDPSVRIVVPSFVVGEGIVEKWYEIPIGTQFVEAGSVIDFIMLLRPVSGELNFASTWDYAKANTDPASGQISHLSDASQFLVHAYDYYAVDQSANLDLIVPGSLITMYDTGVTWEVLQVDFASNIYTFTVEPATRSSNAVSVFTFYYYTSSDIYYVYETDLYASDARISGYIAAEYDPTNSAYFDDNAYGIDIKVQNAVSSADWEIVAYPPDVIAGGGSGSSLVNWEESDTVFRPVTSGDGQLGDATHLISGLYLGDDAAASFGSAGSFNIFYYTTNTSGRIQSTSLLELVTTSSVSITFATSATDRWGIDGTGEFLPATDSTYSIGADATRVLKLWTDDIESTNVPTIAGGSFIDAAVPDQSSSAGYFLTTDGSNVSWAAVLTYWEESGTVFQPVVSGYDIGSATNLIGDAYFGDSGVIYFGADQDGSLYHNGTNLFLTDSTGNIYFDSTSGSVVTRTAGANRWIIDQTGDFYPNLSDTYSIGSTSYTIAAIYLETYAFFGAGYNAYIGIDAAATAMSLWCDSGITSITFYNSASPVWQMLSGTFRPGATATYNIGSSTRRVQTIYSVDALNTSDERRKYDIFSTDLGLDFIDRLRPVSYKLNYYDNDRTRYGLVAQEVESVLKDIGKGYNDFRGIHYEEDEWSMDYSHFIAPLIKAVQELKQKVDVLEAAA